MMVVIKN